MGISQLVYESIDEIITQKEVKLIPFSQKEV